MHNPLIPEYLFHPRQILRRILFRPSMNQVKLPLPWNCEIGVHSTHESIGRAIATQGVYDLAITEAAMRLIFPGETVLDVGANCGYMSLVLALSAGVRGEVFSFEPNPEVLPILEANITRWQALPIAPIYNTCAALSNYDGSATLSIPLT